VTIDPVSYTGVPRGRPPDPTSRHGLILLNAGLGNTLMSVPLLHDLATARPGWRFRLLATPVPGEVVERFPETVQFVPPATPPLWRRFLEPDRPAMLAFLAAESIDLVINLRKEALADDHGYRAFRRQATGFGITCWDLHELADSEINQVPFVDQARRLLRGHLGAGPQHPSDYLRDLCEPPDERTIGLFLGASRAAKRWQPRRWRRTVEQLLTQNPGVRVELAGGTTPDELQLLEDVRAGLPSSRVRTVTLSDFTAVLRWTGRLSVLLSGDTSVLHAASAIGVPSVGLYFSTLGSVWGPTESGTVLQGALGAECPAMRINGTCRRLDTGCPAPCRAGIRPEQAAQAVSGQLATASNTGRNRHGSASDLPR